MANGQWNKKGGGGGENQFTNITGLPPGIWGKGGGGDLQHLLGGGESGRKKEGER